MTDKRRKYKFNWLAHLYYFGMGNDEMPLNWRHLTPFYVSVNSILIIGKDETVNMIWELCYIYSYK